MKHRLTTLSPLAVVLAATAALSTPVSQAQSGDDTLWLKCQESQRSGRYHISFDYLNVRGGSIVGYLSRSSGGLARWEDLCSWGNGVGHSFCQVNDDTILAQFYPAGRETVLTIDRRTAEYSWRILDRQGMEAGIGSGFCRQTADPRPPAAF
jgi:hypothetical protein